MQNIMTLFLDQENEIELSGLFDPLENEYVNDANVEVIITDRSGVVLSGPHTMNYVSDSDGRYVGSVPVITSAFDGQRVIVIVEATAGSGFGSHGKWSEPAIFDTRRATDLTCC